MLKFIPKMFYVKRDGTLEFSISCHLNHRDNRITRDDVVKSVRDGLSYRATFKDNSKKAKDNLLEKGVHLRGSFCYLAEAEPTNTIVNISNLPSELAD